MNFKLVLICALSLMLGGCKGCSETAKDATQTVTQKTVETTKGALSGIKEGLEEGRKNSESLDGAKIVTSLEDLKDKGTVNIGKVTKNNNGKFEVELIVENTLDIPLRITGLTGTGVMVLLDGEGFASPLTGSTENHSEITVLPKAKQKFKYFFNGDIETPTKLRILGKEMEVKLVENSALVTS
ncbi:MAG: hypothetical protein JXR97_14075 [Planctomycetes bacterium]|nr:hypothetical protein [Planctomycetota bacterium]